MFFFVEDYLRLRDEVAARGCDVPIIAGIMPIISVTGIERAALLSGARFPEDLAAELRDHADDKSAVRKIGVEYAAGMCERLIAEGVPGLHFYTLNGSRATREIYQLLGLGPRENQP
jgi:methylenetetrahydrofolate reductase (NADPH)